MKQHFVQPDGLPPANGYSHVVTSTGPTVYVSGQVPADTVGRIVGRGDAEAQVAQVFANIATALAAAGLTLADVVKLTVYLTDIADLPAFLRVRDKHFAASAPPASTLVQVRGLVHPEFRVEIDVVAAG